MLSPIDDLGQSNQRGSKERVGGKKLREIPSSGRGAVAKEQDPAEAPKTKAQK